MEIDWTHVLSAWGPWIAPTVAAVGAFLLSWRNGKKADKNNQLVVENTKLTKDQGDAQAIEAKETKDGVADLKGEFNGKLEKKITNIVKEQIAPVHDLIRTHTDKDDNTMVEIRDLMAGAERRMIIAEERHERHKIANESAVGYLREELEKMRLVLVSKLGG